MRLILDICVCSKLFFGTLWSLSRIPSFYLNMNTPEISRSVGTCRVGGAGVSGRRLEVCLPLVVRVVLIFFR